MPRKVVDMFELCNRFNDIVMRELGLDIDETGRIVDVEKETYYTIKDKYIKYKEEPYTPIRHDEIELNLLENPRLMETIALPFFVNYCNDMRWEFHSTSQVVDPATEKGCYVMNYVCVGETYSIQSKPYFNESLRVFDLICMINKTEVLYKRFMDDFDIKIDKKK